LSRAESEIVARTAPQLHARIRVIERISCFEPVLDPMSRP
jgi:hypothetical protein